RVRRRLVGAAGLVGQRRVLKLQREFTVAVGLIGVGDHRLPAGRAAVLPGAAVGGLAAAELDAGMLGVPPLAVLGLDQQARVEPGLLMGRRAEVIVGEDRADGPILAALELVEQRIGPPALDRGLGPGELLAIADPGVAQIL